MGIATFIYGNHDIPTADGIMDDILAVAVQANCLHRIDEGTAANMIEGLTDAWIAARQHEISEDHDEFNPRYIDTPELEATFRSRYRRAYAAAFGVPEDQLNSETGWWPDYMLSYTRSWPRLIILRLASTLGSCDAELGKQAMREMEERVNRGAL